MSNIYSNFNTDIDTTNTIKLKISASQSADSTTPWAFSVNFGNNANLDTTKAIELVSCSISHTVPNISSVQGNNIFELITTSGLFTYVVPQGFYSANDLINILQPLLNAFITPSISLFSINPQGLFNITITSGMAEIRNSVNNSVGYLLGYETLNSFTTSLTGDILPQLNGIVYFHVRSNVINSYCYSNSISDANTNSCLFSIPVTVPFGFQNVYENQNNQERIRFKGQISLKNFDLQLLDQNYRLLTDMDPRSYVEIIVKIIY